MVVNSEQVAAAMAAAVVELERQHETPRGDSPYVDAEGQGEGFVLVDGNVDIRALVVAVLLAV